MGTAVSRNLDITSNEYCLKFVAKDPIIPNDPFWNRFLTYNITPPITTNDQLILESRIEPLCQELLKNNLTSGNFGSLIQLFLVRSSELLSATYSDANLFNWQLFNTLFTIRCILKFLIESTTEEQLLQHIEFKSNGSTFESLVGALVSILVDVPINDSTYLIHLEAVTCLLVLLSIQFHSGQRCDQSSIYHLIMRGKHVIHAPVLVKSLLTNFMKQENIPPGYGGTQGSSIVLGLASDLWSILTFRRKTEDLVVSDQKDFQETPLATQSLLLVLVLVHQWATQYNPYRNCLFSCLNSLDNNPVPPIKVSSLFKINYNLLYITLCKKANSDAATLLLYLLLHQNPSFKSFLLGRVDLDQLIIPILKTLYNAASSNSHHIYMSLIILLILSEDDSFNKMIHEMKLKNITWYTERALTEISLGGLLILVVIRTVQYNMLKMRDKYLHTNCLAALANMSAQFRELHPYVCQRLVSLFEILAKKYHRLINTYKSQQSQKDNEFTITMNQDASNMEQDLSVLEEVLRMVLEILNSCLSMQLGNNPNLIYTLLYNKHMFVSFKDDVVFQDVIHNIDIIVKYFSQILNEKSQQCEVDAHQVLLIIQQGAKTWPKEKLTKFPDLKFKYVEEDQPEDFFIPYVWTLVNQQSVLHWTNDSSPILSMV